MQPNDHLPALPLMVMRVMGLHIAQPLRKLWHAHAPLSISPPPPADSLGSGSHAMFDAPTDAPINSTHHRCSPHASDAHLAIGRRAVDRRTRGGAAALPARRAARALQPEYSVLQLALATLESL